MQTFKPMVALAVPVVSLVIPNVPLSAQVLHVNDRWDECAFVIDPMLTQGAWHQFVKEAGVVTYFRPMASAEPLGTGHFEIGFLNWGMRIDPADAAWNDTFSHPDPEHWLFEGDDLIAASRTAYDDGVGGARNAHDANYLTFHRIGKFRTLAPADAVVDFDWLQRSDP